MMGRALWQPLDRGCRDGIASIGRARRSLAYLAVLEVRCDPTTLHTPDGFARAREGVEEL